MRNETSRKRHSSPLLSAALLSAVECLSGCVWRVARTPTGRSHDEPKEAPDNADLAAFSQQSERVRQRLRRTVDLAQGGGCMSRSESDACEASSSEAVPPVDASAMGVC